MKELLLETKSGRRAARIAVGDGGAMRKSLIDLSVRNSSWVAVAFVAQWRRHGGVVVLVLCYVLVDVLTIKSMFGLCCVVLCCVVLCYYYNAFGFFLHVQYCIVPSSLLFFSCAALITVLYCTTVCTTLVAWSLLLRQLIV